jgi:hypothetical protein
MHWYDLPKVTHNEDAIREYDRAESQRLGRWIKRLLFAAIPLVLLILWLIYHKG